MKVRTEARRDAILGVAAAVFHEFGYERASMAEIAARVGGSKATLYGYFPSKEALFLAVARSASEAHMRGAVADLVDAVDADPAPVLQRFGEKLLEFLASPESIAVHRMVVAVAGQSDVGRLFYEAGPMVGRNTVARYFEAAMASGRLRRADPFVTAEHFSALVAAEMQPLLFCRDAAPLSPADRRANVERAVAAFLGGYRPTQA